MRSPDHRPTLATIVATLGPASTHPDMLVAMIRAGVGVFRLNLSHGTPAEHASRVRLIRAASTAVNLPVAIMGDLPGPKIRLGILPDAGIPITPGQSVLIDPSIATCSITASGTPIVNCSYTTLAEDVRLGHRVLIADGTIRLRAVERHTGDAPTALRCEVEPGSRAGTLLSRKGVNLPDSDLRLGAMTERDWELVEWAVGQGLDLLALSFVRNANEVALLQQRLASITSTSEHTTGGAAAEIPVVAKIETPQAVANMDAIVKQADAIMVARGDLGVEMDVCEVPIVQRRLIESARSWGKPCIVATQMLESMITSPSPTRAEVSDIANAILDEADAVMLSGETAMGTYPLESVEVMSRTIRLAEAYLSTTRTQPTPPKRIVETGYRTAALAHGAWYVAHDTKAKLVVCWSQHGGLARYLSQTGYSVPIIAYSSSERHTRRMALLKGVRPLLAHVPDEPSASLALWNDEVDRDLLARGWAKVGDPIILIAGRPLGAAGVAGAIAVHQVGNPGTGFRAHG